MIRHSTCIGNGLLNRVTKSPCPSAGSPVDKILSGRAHQVALRFDLAGPERRQEHPPDPVVPVALHRAEQAIEGERDKYLLGPVATVDVSVLTMQPIIYEEFQHIRVSEHFNAAPTGREPSLRAEGAQRSVRIVVELRTVDVQPWQLRLGQEGA